MKKNYWLWNKDTKNFQYYGNSGKALTVAELDENAKAQNTYTDISRSMANIIAWMRMELLVQGM